MPLSDRDASAGADTYSESHSEPDPGDTSRAERIRARARSVKGVPEAIRSTGRQATQAAQSAVRTVGSATIASGSRLAQRAISIAPRIPVRELSVLQEQHQGLTGEALADALVDSAARHSSALGAASGAAAVRLAMRRNPITLPLQVVAEPLMVAAVEIKLLAELHEVYDVPVLGSGAERARQFATTWANLRGLNVLEPGSATVALGSVSKLQLSRQVAARIGGRFAKSGPFLAGAAASGFVNGRGTREFAEAARTELRRLRDAAAADRP